MNLKKAYYLLNRIKNNNHIKNIPLKKTCNICKLKTTCELCKHFGHTEGQKWYEQSRSYLSE